MVMEIGEDDWLVCCGSVDFAKLMVKAYPFNSFRRSNRICEKYLIGKFPSPSTNADFARRSVSEQSTAFATTSDSALEATLTTHVLDVSRGAPAVGVEVHLEVWNDTTTTTTTTDKDGRSGPLVDLVEDLKPGTYRISFNTGKYSPGGFFPYISIAFEVRESQKWEHFHVQMLLSPFSFSTNRGS
ncbi:hypothetical protein N665_0198s0233 [Sinapis alba]|nr:hypothetical protein N665_0198s0233 [Sinapis alba]